MWPTCALGVDPGGPDQAHASSCGRHAHWALILQDQAWCTPCVHGQACAPYVDEHVLQQVSCLQERGSDAAELLSVAVQDKAGSMPASQSDGASGAAQADDFAACASYRHCYQQSAEFHRHWYQYLRDANF